MITSKTLSAFILSGLFAGLSISAANAQNAKPEDPAMKIYRETPPKINDLVHTKLDVRFDYKKTLPIWQGMGYFKTAFLSDRQLKA